MLCLGHRADAIKNYFLNYNECVSNDFILSEGGKNLELMGSDIHDWKITFADTGITSNIGQRLKAVEKISGGRGGISGQLQRRPDRSVTCPSSWSIFTSTDKIASFVCVRPNLSYHMVSLQRR